MNTGWQTESAVYNTYNAKDRGETLIPSMGHSSKEPTSRSETVRMAWGKLQMRGPNMPLPWAFCRAPFIQGQHRWAASSPSSMPTLPNCKLPGTLWMCVKSAGDCWQISANAGWSTEGEVNSPWWGWMGTWCAWHQPPANAFVEDRMLTAKLTAFPTLQTKASEHELVKATHLPGEFCPESTRRGLTSPSFPEMPKQ